MRLEFRLTNEALWLIPRRKFVKSVVAIAGAAVPSSLTGCADILSTASGKKSGIRIDHISHSYDEYIFRAPVGFAGAVVSRDDILDCVWGYDVFPSTRTVDNFIVRLRKHLETDPAQPRYIHTVRGVGYRYTPQGEDQHE